MQDLAINYPRSYLTGTKFSTNTDSRGNGPLQIYTRRASPFMRNLALEYLRSCLGGLQIFHVTHSRGFGKLTHFHLEKLCISPSGKITHFRLKTIVSKTSARTYESFVSSKKSNNTRKRSNFVRQKTCFNMSSKV